ncbi:MAG: sulfatase [Rikenellaceae bacterium]
MKNQLLTSAKALTLASGAMMLSGAVTSCQSKGKESLKNPNVLLIMVDDLNDWVGVMQGHTQAITPNIDALVERGVFFTNAHCAQPVSTASRNALLSGLHPSTTGWYGGTETMSENFDEVMAGSSMMPQYFKENGYNTYVVGKVFHNGASDYPERTADFWTECAPEFWAKSKMEPHILASGKGYRGHMFYPFTSDGGQLYQENLKAYGEEKMKYYEQHNRFYSLCGGPLSDEEIPTDGMYDEQIAAWTVNKLNEVAKSDTPFLMATGFIRPHVPYTAPQKYFDMYDKDAIIVPQIPADDMNDVPLFGKTFAYGSAPMGDWYEVNCRREGIDKELVHAYLASTTFMDEQLGKVMAALDESGLSENTIVVLCSDHGQQFGEKRSYRKQDLWEESTRVPMLIALPKGYGEKDLYYDHPASLLDLYPTLVSLCGLPENEHLEGANLEPILWDVNSMVTEPTLISWRYGSFAVRSDNWRYIQYRDGSQELYDHRVDPGEYKNLASDPAYAQVIEEHKRYIPENPTLLVGTTEFTGDASDKRLLEWKKNGVPEWLQ